MRFVVYVVAVLAANVASLSTLRLTLSAPPAIDSIDDLVIHTRLTNTGSEPVNLIKAAKTVVSNLPTDKFTIQGPVCAPDFTGVMIASDMDRALKSNDERNYILLDPGISFEVVHNLAGVYNFTQSGIGEYIFTVKHAILYADGSGKPAEASVESEPIMLTLRGSLSTEQSRSKASTYSHLASSSSPFQVVGFDLEHSMEILAAAEEAKVYIAAATKYLKDMANGGPAEKFEKWFGKRNIERFEIVKRMFRDIAELPMRMIYQNYCEGKDADIAAFITLDKDYVNLCAPFWDRPKSASWLSRAGTIVHEATHSRSHLRSTLDHAAGMDQCLKLAKEDPNTAVNNADSYRLFTEDLHGNLDYLDQGWLCRIFGWFC